MFEEIKSLYGGFLNDYEIVPIYLYVAIISSGLLLFLICSFESLVKKDVNFWQSLYKWLSRIVKYILKNTPFVIAIILLYLISSVVLDKYNNVIGYITEREKIDNMKIVLKQLNQRYRVAEIDFVGYDDIKDETQMYVRVYDAKGRKFNTSSLITMRGSVIYLDAIVMNFDYTKICDGRINLAVPYRLYSNVVNPNEGVELFGDVPEIYKHEQIYGVTRNVYNECLDDILKYSKSPELAKRDGVRCIYGNAVRASSFVGWTAKIWVEATGGMVIKSEEGF